ncbi:MAG: hypothetical protein EXR69_06610 [Myxococcales bacterium]|nr:hypothetical protein [Myxococcales bacterium]
MTALVSLTMRVIEAAGLHLPTWAWPLSIVALALVLLPFRFRGERANTARRILLKSSAAGSVSERDRLEDQAISEVRGEVHGLLTIASWAVERGRYPLARRVLALPQVAGQKERFRLLAAMTQILAIDPEALAAKVLNEPAPQRHDGQS